MKQQQVRCCRSALQDPHQHSNKAWHAAQPKQDIKFVMFHQVGVEVADSQSGHRGALANISHACSIQHGWSLQVVAADYTYNKIQKVTDNHWQVLILI